jgi:hypothetical protein
MLIGFCLASLLGFSVIRSIRSIFSSGNNDNRRQAASSRSQQQRSRTTQQKQRTKVIKEDEGEYIDYEEVK